MKKIAVLILIALVFVSCDLIGSGSKSKTWGDVAKEAQKLEEQKRETIKAIGEKSYY